MVLKMANKRVRVPNFSSEEETLLVSLVEDYKNIIECKKTGNSTWQEKKLAWEAIENKFNSQNNKSIRRYGTN
ncbi:hypothetical protein ABEB36_000155 [Hypothenemus hampei]|uniref:Regulatory protein zeste n=1 Tax=Hypothenemus hampei TaxID=57062 RepID=A0ABD1FDJ0_HYPHA